jgi:hypothetical protein
LVGVPSSAGITAKPRASANLHARHFGARAGAIMKHEQAMNDSKNKTDTLRFARRTNRFVNRDDVLVWLSLAWFVALCGAAIWVFFWPAYSIFGF